MMIVSQLSNLLNFLVFNHRSDNNPGFIEIPGRMSVMEAVFRAGGHKRPTARLENVVVIRHKKGKRLDYKLNLKKALDGDEENIFMLEPFDVVYPGNWDNQGE